MLEARGLSIGYGRRDILSGIDLHLKEGEICVLIGANGCGKSTLLRTLAGLETPSKGSVHLSGSPINKLSRREIARKIAVMTQSPTGPEGLTIAQLVIHGLFARKGLFGGSETAEDRRVVQDALEQTGLSNFADRRFDALSGGERQRVWIALALAQQPRLLLLDEPTSYLDMGHQQEILTLLCDLRDQRGLGIAMVLHDINHAIWFADHIVALKDRRIIAQGHPAEVVTPELVYALYGARVSLLSDPTDMRPYCVPEGRINLGSNPRSAAS
ncbi:ABC transporter ATP-binding protein [Shimia sp. MMG029]|uniref:ABC transporter ATP-binding protein n=1 Tax=Shimia sp. MMG029 TaxID=3021978 RepID=UPI0022FED7E2|nr:ABC transporter ATP-binding protein [Shimia sp. MMG029]MDA5558702.1 ABC transporter ATP-binding protein [Shimia sp. MMG029]